jgi:hypothetical protein
MIGVFMWREFLGLLSSMENERKRNISSGAKAQ